MQQSAPTLAERLKELQRDIQQLQARPPSLISREAIWSLVWTQWGLLAAIITEIEGRKLGSAPLPADRRL